MKMYARAHVYTQWYGTVCKIQSCSFSQSDCSSFKACLLLAAVVVSVVDDDVDVHDV